MNKIEQLIAEHCPNGIEYKELGCFIDYIQPTKYIVKSTNYNNDFKTPVLTAGQSFVLGYTDEDSNIYHANKKNAVMIFDDFTTSFHWVDFDFKIKSSAMKILVPKPSVDISFRYLYYAMKCIAYKPQNHERHWISKYSLFKIPAPPLTVQKEVVRILDKFTALEAELEAELEARRKQYEYYRDNLLNFSNLKRGGYLVADNSLNIKWLPLGEIGKFTRGKRFVKTDIIESGIPCIHYGEMYTHYGVWADKSKSFISKELCETKNLRVAEKGDVVIVAAGETIEDIGVGTAWLGGEGVVIHDACFSYRSRLNPKYVSYFTRTKQFHDQIKKNVSSGKISAINANGLGKVLIPIPSPEEQERIVGILDKFDILTTSISEGLPREISQRKKQYEYYRDMLLAFPKE